MESSTYQLFESGFSGFMDLQDSNMTIFHLTNYKIGANYKPVPTRMTNVAICFLCGFLLHRDFTESYGENLHVKMSISRID
jgi:hypothetical protein